MATRGQLESKKQEKRIAKSLSQLKDEAQRTIASGALWFKKSDIVSKLFRVEAKTKAKPSKQITIKKEWVDKIELEAAETNKIPALALSFGTNFDYFMIKDRDFYALIEELVALREEKGGNEDE